MKYFLGTIEEKNGDKEYAQQVFYAANSHDEAIAKHKEAAKKWYCADYEEAEDGWIEFDGDYLCVLACDDLHEISQTTFFEMGNKVPDEDMENMLIAQIKGGVLQSVTGHNFKGSAPYFNLIDWDNIEQGDDAPTDKIKAMIENPDFVIF